MKKKWYQADSSVMTGDVSVAEGVSIWHNATLRGGYGADQDRAEQQCAG